MAERLLPDRVRLGDHMQSAFIQVIHIYNSWKDEGSKPDPLGRRMVMGFVLPEWQRDAVWTESQKVKFIESLILGIPLGTYTFTQFYDKNPDITTRYDNLLIDGQQRLTAIQDWIDGKIRAFGMTWDDLTPVDRRELMMSRTFACYIYTRCSNDAELRNYYNIMNFGGTPHKEEERA